MLKECDTIDLTRISSPNDYIAAASSSETLEQIEEVVTSWVRQIEQVRTCAENVHPNSYNPSVVRVKNSRILKIKGRKIRTSKK